MTVAPIAGPPRPVADPRGSGSATASSDDGGFAALMARSSGATAGEAAGAGRHSEHPHHGDATAADPGAPDVDASDDAAGAGPAAGQPLPLPPGVGGAPPWVALPTPAPGTPGTPGTPGSTDPVVTPAALGRAATPTAPTGAPATRVDAAPTTVAQRGSAGAAPVAAPLAARLAAPVAGHVPALGAAAGPGPRHAGAREAERVPDGAPAAPATGTETLTGPGGSATSTVPLTRTEHAAATSATSGTSGTPHAGTVTRQVFGEVVRLAETGPRHGATQHVTLRLDPGSLGEVRVTLSMRGGSVRVRLATTSTQAHDDLTHGAPELRRLLGSRGDDVVVTVRDTSASGSPSGQRDDGTGRPAADLGTGPDPRSGGSSSGSHQTPDGEHPGASSGDPGRRARTPAATHATDGAQDPATRSRPEYPLLAGRPVRLDLSV